MYHLLVIIKIFLKINKNMINTLGNEHFVYIPLTFLEIQFVSLLKHSFFIFTLAEFKILIVKHKYKIYLSNIYNHKILFEL